ncbi:glutathione S-transferase C-terminal domain-containing protein [Janthinobacterium sp. LB3P112]|uniref:glutathione S-transferase C-terminal domain-containing protein n=1 Tax=Janthinobacterium sp. LB3P112 TaxID=3424196 RepID=UPI003F1E9331
MLRSADFRATRLPKFLDSVTQVLLNNGSRGQYLMGSKLMYGDLSLFQMLAGLQYAFPQAMARLAPQYPALFALHDTVAARPNIARYLKSKRRIAFNEEGIFRHYPELDGKKQPAQGPAVLELLRLLLRAGNGVARFNDGRADGAQVGG